MKNCFFLLYFVHYRNHSVYLPRKSIQMDMNMIKYFTVFRPQAHFGKPSFTRYSTDMAGYDETRKAAISPKCEKNIKSINNSTKYLAVSDIILNTHIA